MLRTIKSKLLIFALSISLIPILVLTTIFYLNARSTLKNQILRELSAIAESKKIHTLSFMNGKRGRTIDFSSDGFIRDSLETISYSGYQSNAVTKLNSHLKVNKKPLDPQIVAIAVVDTNGKIVSSTNEEMIGVDVSKHELFFKSIRNNYGETYIDHTHRFSFLDEDCIFISAPLTRKNGGEKIGIIVNAYDLESLNEITANRIGMGETGEVVIGQKKGNDIIFLNSLRYSPDAVLELTVSMDDPSAVPMEKALSGDNGLIIAPDYRNVTVLAAYQYIPELDWGLVAKMDRAEAFAPLKLLRNIALIAGGACGVIAIFGGVVFSLSAARPISKLKDATDRFAKGDMDSRVNVAGKDEVSDLARSFNNMAEEIKLLTESLEKRIAERTWKLTRANEKLLIEINWRKQTEEELRKLSCAVEQSPATVVITDIKGNIEYVNPKFTQVTGYTFEEVKGHNSRILKSGKQAPEVYKELWDTIMSGGEWHGELHNKKKNGELYWEFASISPIRNTEDVITHFIAVKEDITERKRMEEELQELNSFLEKRVAERTLELKDTNFQLQAEIVKHKRTEDKLAVTNKELEAFCYSVSHDLRAPLRGIDGFGKILETEYAKKLDEQGMSHLKRIRAASQRMGQLITDLLSLSRITRKEMKQEKVDLSTMVHKIASALQKRQPERQVEFAIAEGLFVRGDINLLKIAMDNLMDNAWKFTEKHSQTRIEFGISLHNGEHVYFVRDDGAGFDMTYVGKLFGAFQRLHSLSEFEGTGIGLATVQRIIHRHGGRIWAEGAVEQGATFYFTL